MIVVVIVNWNGRHLLDACLEAVTAQQQPPELTVVVDNGSTDDSVAHLRRNWPSVEVIPLAANRGVAAGNNAGIRRALEVGADAVLLLNNDAAPQPDALGLLVERLERGGPSVWAVAPKIVYRGEPSRIWSAGGEISWWRGLAKDYGTDAMDRGQFDEGGPITYANTCCLLIRARIFREIGFMDEAYFMYFDDADLCARIRAAGGVIVYMPRAMVLHDVQASSGGAPRHVSRLALYYATRNRARFIARNAPGVAGRFWGHGFNVVSRGIRVLEAFARRDYGTVRIILAALIDAYLHGAAGPTTRRDLVGT